MASLRLNRSIPIVFAVLSGLCQSAKSDPLLSLGSDIPLFITVSTSVRHDDNVLLVPDDKTGDTIFLLTPGVDLHMNGGSGSAGITFSEQFSHYAHLHSLDDQLADLAGNLAYNGTSSKFAISGTYEQEDQSVTEAESLDQTVKHTIAELGGDAELEMTAKTHIGLSPSFSRTMFPEQGFENSDVWTVPVDLYYGVTEKTDLSMGYAYTRTTTEDDAGDAKGSFFNVGIRGTITPKISGQIRVGVTEQKPDGGTSTSQLGLEAALTYLFTPRTTFSLDVNNGFAPSASGNQTEVLSASLGGNFTLSPQWTATVGSTFSNTKYLITPARTDHFWTESIGLEYIYSTALNFSATYFYRRNQSTDILETFDDNIATLTASCRF